MGGALRVRLLGDGELLTGLGMRAVEHRFDLLEVARGEPVELEMLTALDVRLAFGDLVGRDPRGGEQLHQISAGQVLKRLGVRDLVHTAATSR